MFERYLVTGATGFLGRTVAELLAAQGAGVTALALPGDPAAKALPMGVEVIFGDVCNPDSLCAFFRGSGKNVCVIHCAGMVSIRTRPGPQMRRVNVDGTGNILSLCRRHDVGRLVYVSSVHAIPERKQGQAITEVLEFSPQRVSGPYAKSKAEATAMVLDAARNGLNACVVHPSGIIGPGDTAMGSTASMIAAYCKGRLPMGVKGGYDFVDVRDVARGGRFLLQPRSRRGMLHPLRRICFHPSNAASAGAGDGQNARPLLCPRMAGQGRRALCGRGQPAAP